MTDQYVMKSIRIPATLAARIDEYAKREDRSWNRTASRLLEAYLELLKKEEAARANGALSDKQEN